MPENQIALKGTETETIIETIGWELTPQQKSKLDEFMGSGDPCVPPANIGNTTFRLKDIWGMRQDFLTGITVSGVAPRFWFESEQLDGSGTCYMYIQFPKSLSTAEKNRVKNWITNAIVEI